jgi:hypothetical protein
MLHPFHSSDLFQPPTVAVAAIELGPEEGTHELGGELCPHDLGAEAEDVHVVVLDALVRRVRVVTDSRTDSGELVRRDGGAHARAAHEHTALYIAGKHGLADLSGEVRIIHARLGRVDAEVHCLMIEFCDGSDHAFAQFEPAVVEGYGDTQRAGTLPT